MFATMYSTQAILPVLAREFDVSPAHSGLTVSVVVVALAAGSWAWGPLSDRFGRRSTILLASGLLVLPTVATGLAPTFELLLAFRALQGFCMPGLLTVGVPYVMEAFGPRIGGLAMGSYVAALVAGGLVGRVGVALVTDVAGWRWAVGGIAVLPLLGTAIMRASLPEAPAPARGGGKGLRRQLGNARLWLAAAVGGGLFFTFVGAFSYVVFRLEEPPFGYGTAAGGLVFLLWITGAFGPLAGRLADRIGWRRLALASLGLGAAGLLLSLPALLPTLVLGLALVTTAMFAGVTAAQLGVSAATEHDRGLASALYFSLYYGAGALGAYVPGLAWEAWGWNGVALLALGVLGLPAAALLGRARRW